MHNLPLLLYTRITSSSQTFFGLKIEGVQEVGDIYVYCIVILIVLYVMCVYNYYTYV